MIPLRIKRCDDAPLQHFDALRITRLLQSKSEHSAASVSLLNPLATAASGSGSSTIQEATLHG